MQLVDSGSESIKIVQEEVDLGELDDESTGMMESEKEGVLEANKSSTATLNENSSVTGMCNMLLISYIYCLIIELLFAVELLPEPSGSGQLSNKPIFNPK